MDTISRQQVDQLAEDIAFVKKAIEKNSSILQRMDFRSSFRLVTLLSVISVFFFCGLFHFLMKHFGGYPGIPLPIKVIVYGAMALVVIIIGLLKNSGILKSARTANPGISILGLMKEYYSIRLYQHFIPMALVVIFVCAYCVATGNARLLVPIISIGAGIILSSLDTLLRTNEFLLTSYWLIVTGCSIMMFNSISPLLSISLTFGCGMLLLSATLYMPRRKRVEE
jgi:hypothetical protein